MEAAEGSATMQKVVEMTRGAIERGDSPLLWAVEVVRCLENSGLEIPSAPLGHTLAACLFSCSPLPSFSSFLLHALSSHLVSSFHILALLTPRVLQARRSRPEVYSLFLELASMYIFNLGSTKAMPCCNMVVKAVDEVLQLSVLSGVAVSDFGTAAVQFSLNFTWRMMEAIVEDLKAFLGKSDKQDKGSQISTLLDSSMEADEGFNEQQIGEREQLRKTNCITAITLVSKMLHNKKTLSLLRLARKNFVDQWGVVTRCFRSLEMFINDALPKGALDAIVHLVGSFQQGLCQDSKAYQFPILKVLVESRTSSWSYGSEVGRAAAWLPIDIFMEDVIVGTRIIATSVVEALAELVKSLQSIQNASWHDMFLALWISAVRLLPRELENMEGPRPLFGSRLSMVLSIVPLASALLIEEEEKQLLDNSASNCSGPSNDKEGKVFGERRAAFVSSLKVLGQFEDLLTLPQKAATAAHQAAASAAAFVAGFNHGNMAFEGLGVNDGSSGVRTGGNLRHLIVETCIARGLLDTSAYFWPGYVGAVGTNIPLPVSPPISPWKKYMDGAPLSASLKNSLLSTPAKSKAELEKIFQAAISGPEEDRPAAASILCGASLMRSWNVQEHAVCFVLHLLSPPSSTDGKINGHSLIQHAPMLSATLWSIHETEALHVLSLYGMTSEVAAALLPICEVFGSLSPTVPLMTGSKEEISMLTVFSLAFLILIKICKFHRAPLEHWTTGSGINLFNNTSLEYLLVRHNLQVASLVNSLEAKGADDLDAAKKLLPFSSFSLASKSSAQPMPQYVTLDSFPRLKAWFLHQKSWITSSNTPGAASGDSVHQVGDRLLAMMLKKSNKSGNMPTTSAGASVSSTGSDDVGAKPLLPAWDLLAAVPFVVDTMLTACGHGKLLPRDLTTGLRELVDFFPASIASLISFLEAEVIRGLWRPAPMNGKDWPSPAANLLSIEAEMRDMLSSSGASVPTCVTGSISGNVLVTLPLPLAALLSLTITFKVDKFSVLLLSVGGPALQNIAGGSGCSSVVAALWSQKVRRWHDYIMFGLAECSLRNDKNAASKVLKSCFAATLGTTNNLLTAHGGVGALLGHTTNWMHAPTVKRQPIPPGILFLRICPSLHDVMFLPGEILTLLVKSVREFSAVGNEGGGVVATTARSGSRMRCLQSSLATNVSRVSQASTLAASLLFVSGGSTLGQLLYTETLPAWFLSGQKSEGKLGTGKGGSTALLEGYAVAYFALLSGVFVWGVSESKVQRTSVSSLKMAAVSSHMRFLAAALDGKMSLACDPTTWKAYVRSFLSLTLTRACNWISYVDAETLKRIAIALRMWHEYDLAAALLESGGSATLHVAGELAAGF